MAYSANAHDNFSRRATNWVRQFWALREEGQRLTAIYWNEANGDENWVDTPLATTAELVSFLNILEDYERLISGSGDIVTQSRIANCTPFLQGE